MGPDETPEGTCATNCPNVIPVGTAACVPLNFTMGVPTFRFAPFIVTAVPADPNPGEKVEIVGRTTKFEAEKVDPPGVKTRIRPVVAPTGTAAVMCELLRILKFVEATPSKDTAVEPRKLVPMIVTLVFIRPNRGVTLAIVGGPKKFAALEKLPRTVLTVMGPVVTPEGAFTWINVSEVAATMIPSCPLKVTFVTPVRCKPLMVTVVPPLPKVGKKSVT